MKVHLMFPDRDFNLEAKPLANEVDLVQDLEMETLFAAMAAGDEFLGKVAQRAIPDGLSNSRKIVLWRQAVLQDCLANEETIRLLYGMTLEAAQIRKGMFLPFISSHPNIMLSDGRRLLEGLHGVLCKLSAFAKQNLSLFRSEGLRNLCEMLIADLSPGYLEEMNQHLATLHFRFGLLFSARLGWGNEGVDFVPRYFAPERWAWLKELLGNAPPHYRFSLDPRDESGARELSELQDAVLVDMAQITASASSHVEAFFTMLRTELAFYIGCLNLRHQLVSRNTPICIPEMITEGCSLRFEDLRDASLTLTLTGNVIGNDLDALETPLIMITGANQGGKSTFLRSIGLAQMMMQAGMFVTARAFAADLRDGVFTHYRRREDKDLNSGKFDEELRRMNQIVGQIGHAPLFLFNESFAATNEREGAEVARQIITALAEAGGRVVFVTHMYALAEAFDGMGPIPVFFLLAERTGDGRRSFRILPGKPQDTSFGRDLYRQIFHDVAV